MEVVRSSYQRPSRYGNSHIGYNERLYALDDGRSYRIRDVLYDGNPVVCQVARVNEAGKVEWIECEEGSEFSALPQWTPN